jgi:carboxymethylenebutenolidase
MMALDIADAEKVLHGAVGALLNRPETRGEKVGVVGFCMGGQLSLFAATVNPKIGACADFYGIHPNVNPDFSKLQCPVLGLFADQDAYASPEAVSLLSGELTRLGKTHEFLTYPNTHHAFFNDDRPEVYDRQAAEDAWSRTIAFLSDNAS